MSFNDNARLDTSQVTGGAKTGAVVGGGIGSIVLALVVYLLGGGNILSSSGGTTSAFSTDQVTSGGSASSVDVSHCKTGADANKYADCLIVGTVNSVQNYWTDALPKQANRTYSDAVTVIYSGSTQSACGTASNATGPFYCPSDQRVYIDPDFFDELRTKFGSDGGQLAQEYVVAHEYGHRVQDLLGILSKYQGGGTGASSNSVRIELMADCLAGVWANHAATTKDSDGNTLIEPLSKSDITSALSAAAAVGDDHIQQTLGGGSVNQDTWTHGSSAQREKWFTAGYQNGDLNHCNTFGTDSL